MPMAIQLNVRCIIDNQLILFVHGEKKIKQNYLGILGLAEVGVVYMQNLGGVGGKGSPSKSATLIVRVRTRLSSCCLSITFP